MSYLIIAVLVLASALFVSVKINIKRRKAYKTTVNHLENMLRVKDEIEDKKEQIHTDDVTDNFNRSIEFLQEYAKRNQ